MGREVGEFRKPKPKQFNLLCNALWKKRHTSLCVWEKTLHCKKANKIQLINILHVNTFHKGEGRALEVNRLAMACDTGHLLEIEERPILSTDCL